MKKIINVVGARPNFMKIAPVIDEFRKSSYFEPILLHTGQHYDANMSDIFFEELRIPKPDIYLGIGSSTHAKQVAQIMDKFDDVCEVEKPDAILVVGDVNSTMACSLVASKLGIKIIHLEAGLRSFDRTMPEEINRIVTDTLADFLLIPSKDANLNLSKEGIAPHKIHLVGNIMIDTLIRNMPIIAKSEILTKLSIDNQDFALLTLHRPSNVDFKDNLEKILETLYEIQNKIKIIFPIHPRTLKNIQNFDLYSKFEKQKNIIVTNPLGYLDFQRLMVNSKFVITDSGGVQEETTYLKIPCLTLRENTERPITITEGSNRLIGNDMNLLLSNVFEIIENKFKNSIIPEFWDGKTAERVADVLQKKL